MARRVCAFAFAWVCLRLRVVVPWVPRWHRLPRVFKVRLLIKKTVLEEIVHNDPVVLMAKVYVRVEPRAVPRLQQKELLYFDQDTQ